MTSALTPAVSVSVLVAMLVLAGALRGAMAQTPTAQAPAQPPSAQPSSPPSTQPVTPPAVVTPTPMPPIEAGGTPRPIATYTDHGTALMLLDRIATVLNDSVNRKASKSDIVGTTGSDEGPLKVVIDRAVLDEMRAEIAQIKLLLQSEPTSSVALRPREKNEGAR